MASNKSGVFTLGDVGERQETGSWDTASDVWAIGSPVIVGESNVGYFAGGNAAPNVVTQRIDYSNDTLGLLTGGDLTSPVMMGGGVSSLSHGYSVGGVNAVTGSGQISTVNRLDYANDDTTLIPRGPLTTGIAYQSSASNSNY